MKRIKLLLIAMLLIAQIGIVFSQAKKDTCTYQPPKISCQQAQENAEAIYKYPIALKSLSEKDTIIKTKEHEVSMLKSGFTQERKDFKIEIGGLKKDNEELGVKLNTQIGRKKNWRLVAGVSFLAFVIDRIF